FKFVAGLDGDARSEVAAADAGGARPHRLDRHHHTPREEEARQEGEPKARQQQRGRTPDRFVKWGSRFWKPVRLLSNIAGSVGAVLKPAGLDSAEGVLTSAYLQSPTDPDVEGRPCSQDVVCHGKYYPDGDKASADMVYGYMWLHRRWCRCLG